MPWCHHGARNACRPAPRGSTCQARQARANQWTCVESASTRPVGKSTQNSVAARCGTVDYRMRLGLRLVPAV